MPFLTCTTYRGVRIWCLIRVLFCILAHPSNCALTTPPGTKGDNSQSSGLKAIEAKKGTNEVEVEVVTEKADVEANYEAFLLELRSPAALEDVKVDKITAQSDYFRSYRTNLLLSW